jgi:hypothetical protein
MDDYQKREKVLNAFDSKLKDFDENNLLSMRAKERINLSEAKKKIEFIDKEFIRRKPFYSMADKMCDESIRCSDITKCAFYDCNEPSEYYTQIGVKNELYGIFACRIHTQTLYEPLHHCLANRNVIDMVKKRK